MGTYDGVLKLGNLNIQRDWGYAPDYVYAMWLIMQYKEPGDFLVCSGNVWSLKDLVAYVFKHLDLDFEKYVKIDETLFRPTDLEVIYGDNQKAKKLLDWEYNLSNEELIHKLIEDEFKFIEWQETIH